MIEIGIVFGDCYVKGKLCGFLYDDLVVDMY